GCASCRTPVGGWPPPPHLHHAKKNPPILRARFLKNLGFRGVTNTHNYALKKIKSLVLNPLEFLKKKPSHKNNTIYK
ncbi:hypothetical protein, partial [Enterobacter intestinihominis]